MQWLNPAGTWALLGLLPVLVLYILRKKAKRELVPSLLLWRKTQEQFTASKPFQRLRNKLLLWLQLLLVLLLVVALMRPASLSVTQGEMLFVFDLSASMQTQSAGRTRLDMAKEQANQLLDGFKEGSTVTVLAAGEHLEQIVVRSQNLAEARSAISGLRAQNTSADVEGAVALALAMKRDLPAMQIVVFSDCYKAQSTALSVVAVGMAQPNRSILSLRLSDGESGVSAFAQVENCGEDRTDEMECYADGVLCDVRTVTLAANAKQSVRFLLPSDAQRVTVRFTYADALLADDARYAVRPAVSSNKVLLVTQGNVFLEHALALRDGLTVVKATKADAEGITGFDLYLYDCITPEKWPEVGAILAIAPTSEIMGMSMEERRVDGGSLRAGLGENAKAICENLLLSDIALRSYQPVQGGQAVLTTSGHALLSVNEQKARRAALLGFDLHDSNLPLQADFPVLMQNLLHYLLPAVTETVQNASCGSTITLKLNQRALSAHVMTPSGRAVALTEGMLTDTNEIGLYTLIEQYEDASERETDFVLHIPPNECDTQSIVISQVGTGSLNDQEQTGREWSPWIVLLCFLVLIVEWGVSRRGA